MLVSEKYPVGTRVIMVNDWWQPSFYRECYIGKTGTIKSVSGESNLESAVFHIEIENTIFGLTCTEEYFRHLQMTDIHPPLKNKLLPNI